MGWFEWKTQVEYGMRLQNSWIVRVTVASLLGIIITLYLAPGSAKYEVADLICVTLLILALNVFGIRRLAWSMVVKPLTPLIILLAYAIICELFFDHGGEAYVRQLLFGFMPYVAFYVLFSHQSLLKNPFLLFIVFILPGLVHVGYMYYDIGLAIERGEMAFMLSSKHGFLEFVKDAPRVGRRYLSVALLHLLCGALLISWYLRRVPARGWSWALAFVSVVSLALLDARAAYTSLLLGGGGLAIVVGPARAWMALRTFLPSGLVPRCLLACILIVVVVTGYSAGTSRWLAMSDSVAAAVHDVYDSQVELAQRPYVDESFWSAPIPDVGKCYAEGQFRCRIDQSAYLRVAWMISGLESLVQNPWGIGYSSDYMGRLWDVAGENGKYQRSDSFLVELAVSFGLVGVMLCARLVYSLMQTTRTAVQTGCDTVILVAVCGIILICVGRSVVDVFSEGLWRYLLALLGMYYGLLHSSDAWRKRN